MTYREVESLCCTLEANVISCVNDTQIKKIFESALYFSNTALACRFHEASGICLAHHYIPGAKHHCSWHIKCTH